MKVRRHKPEPMTVIAIAVLFTSMLLTGCGSSSTVASSTKPSEAPTPATTRATTPPTTLSRADLVAKMNAICDTGNAQLDKLKKEEASATTNEAAAAFYSSAAAVYGPAITDFEALQPPPEASSSFERYLQSVKRDRGLLTRLATVTRAGETAPAEELKSDLSATSKERVTAAIDVGAERCGR